MKFLLMVDSEGQACVTREPQAQTQTFGKRLWSKLIQRHPVANDNPYGNHQAEFIRRQMTREASACASVLLEGGASRVLILDAGFVRGSYPAGLTMLWEELPPGVEIGLGGVSLKECVGQGFDAAIFLGRHAMAGHKTGVLAHTYSSPHVASMHLNGAPVGEIGIESLQLASAGIPVIMVSGDQAACDEAKTIWGDKAIYASTKTGFGPHKAISLHPQDACALIASKTREALHILTQKQIVSPTAGPLDGRFRLTVQCRSPRAARLRAEKKGGRMVSPKVYEINTENPWDLG